MPASRRMRPLPARGNEPRPAAGRLERAYRQLKTGIMEGTYSPRQHLVEARLTEELAVSRALVRAVLVRLQEEGLVTIEANRGARVRTFSRAEAVEILHVREVLEGLAASLAATRASAADFAAMRAIVEAMERAIGQGDLLGYSSMNGRFHRAICSAARHPTLERALASLHFPLIRYQFRTVLAPGRCDASFAEHRAILAALLKSDARLAERAMRRHLGNVRKVLGRLDDAPQI